MTEKEESPWPLSWPGIIKRLEELERRVAVLEGGESEEEPEEHESAKHKSRRK